MKDQNMSNIKEMKGAKSRAQKICNHVIKEMEKEKTNEYILNHYVTNGELELLSQVFICERLQRHYKVCDAVKFIKRSK